MTFPLATRRAGILLLALAGTAACTVARAADPFPEVALPPPAHHSHAWAYGSLALGAGLIGGSFLISERADASYREYLAATDPGRIEELYDRTVLQDRIASGSLLTGEALLALGVYLRFLRHPESSRASLRLSPGRCALALCW